MNQPQRMSPVVMDKEFKDLLDFRKMFLLPVAKGKGLSPHHPSLPIVWKFTVQLLAQLGLLGHSQWQ
uniref:Uncharacterized protein n=1 Tax=Sciurus vulgaris TaxID=55149 RepID=A0A8D2DZ64_SCIVU